jgi:hypothetical protein
MPGDSVHACTLIAASAEVIFQVLADPAKHAAIDGTGWVRESLHGKPVSAAGQVFRVAMFHPNHPDGDYLMDNLVRVFDPPYAISWEPGYDADGRWESGGWTWRYDLAATAPDRTDVTLTYDWSAVPGSIREYIQFPPFPPDHLSNSLAHLAELAVVRA